MTIETIAYLAPSGETTLSQSGSTTPVQKDFAIWLEQQLGEVNSHIIESDNQLRRLALGEAENLHQVMMSLEKAKLSFELALQVRNRLLEAYQDIMRMQI